MPFFTIIIPTYNSENTLAVVLDSIVSQTCKDIEIILQDGKSNDATIEIANSFKKLIPSLHIYQEKDSGIYDAMNKGMDKATGDWLLFLGGDDQLYENTTLEMSTSILQKSNANVVYGNAKIIGNTGWANDGDIYDGIFNIQKLFKKNICHQAIFYKRDFILNNIGYFNLNYKQCSDWDFNLRCWSKQPFEFVDLIVSNFKAGGVSTDAIDTLFMNDYLSNVIKYFGITPFHKLVNTPSFLKYNDVIKLQKSKYPIRYKLQRVKSVIMNLSK
ncbi:glycosyltransferase family 2 protein [Patiriisocius hiemis]|uniref:Glycosyltransferase family 2 protein n=1 Tax=Patiriisocius hiemis TaxID=3075604 RepID=A0ABU2YCY6_9FLAO|nr:glycosyltransferase family 2 protein [Constantimarinum sp. W242]MDT0556026.1 glycosyltransferase family 2 protein [Constantimarinum sp. W242]